MPYLNPDESRRRLERRARAGDPEAFRFMIQEKARAGVLTTHELTAGGTAAVQAMDPAYRIQLLRTLLRGVTDTEKYGEFQASLMINPENYFPEHDSDDTCPKGHTDGVDAEFRFECLDNLSAPVEPSGERGLAVWGLESVPNLSDALGFDYGQLYCIECGSVWPSTSTPVVEL